MEPRFSVVVPAYNEEAYLGRTLEALAAQDVDGGYEVIVVDNASTDDTAAVARAAGARVLHETEPGVCAARQRGLDAARGAIVVSTDADTLPPNDWLRRIDEAFRTPGTVAVAGPCRYEGAQGWRRRYPLVLFGLVRLGARLTGRVGYVTATNLAIVREHFPAYDRRLTQGGDELDVLRRVRRRGRVAWLHDNPVTTSPRRLRHGFAYHFVVTFVVFYLLAYYANRLAGRQRIGIDRPVREDVAVPLPVRPDLRLGDRPGVPRSADGPEHSRVVPTAAVAAVGATGRQP